MSIESLALALHHSKAKGTDKLVMWGIANHDGDGGAWPSIATLASYANVNERAVQKCLARLVALGEIAVRKRFKDGHDSGDRRQLTNAYDILVSCPPGCDRTTNHRVKALPRSPSGLWIDPPSVGTPGTGEAQIAVLADAPPPSVRVPAPVSVRTPEPSIEPPLNTSLRPLTSEVQTARDDGITIAAAGVAYARAELRRARRA